MTEDNFNQESGAMDKPEETYVNVELDQKTLGVVQKSFDYIVENHNVVDWAVASLPRMDGVKHITNKLNEYSSNQDEGTIHIPMTQAEWIDYKGMIDYVGTVLPKDWEEERLLFDDLSELCFDIDEALQPPNA